MTPHASPATYWALILWGYVALAALVTGTWVFFALLRWFWRVVLPALTGDRLKL